MGASTQSGSGAATRSTGRSGSTRETFPGEARLSPGRPVSSTLSTTPVTTSWSGQRPSSRTPSSSLTPLLSVSGTSPTTPCPLDARRGPAHPHSQGQGRQQEDPQPEEVQQDHQE